MRLRFLVRGEMKSTCNGERGVVGIALRVDLVDLLAVIPGVAKSIPVNALWRRIGGE
jgi:hypothetical protein